jgi:glycosyltransferase involved in cell wall biosynthesis
MALNRVTIIQKSLPHYRLPFFSLLRKFLKEKDIDLGLIYGREQGKSSLKDDEANLSWATYMPARYFSLGSRKVIWHGKLSIPFKSDLVIVENANKLLFNYYLLLTRAATARKMAFWGHSLNFQGNKRSAGKAGNLLKHLLIKQSNWWFAYTKGEKQKLVNMGVKAGRITAVENAIDTLELNDHIQDIKAEEREQLKKSLGLLPQRTAIFIGGMYPEKRLPFLLQCCHLIKKTVPDFNVILLGNGEDAHLAQEAARLHSWIHYPGTKKGREKALYLSLADVILMPGVVGLIVLDSFVSGVPMLTTDIHGHGPEIEYLRHQVNGIVTKNDAQVYSEEVIRLLLDSSRLNQLRQACFESAKIYTVENMARNFADGIEQALNAG